MLDGLRILFAGSGAFGVPTLRSLLEGGADVVQVISQPDKPAGRGKKLTPTPIAQLALGRSVPLLRTGNLNAETLPPADVMVVIAFGQKIAPTIVNHPRLGSVNLHASLLPRHRGAAPIHWAILSGDAVTGNSVIRLADRMDAGAVLATSPPRPTASFTTGELHDQLASDGPEVIARVIAALADGTAVELPQDESLATLAPKLSRESSRLEFAADDADAIARRVRAMYPWPGCRVRLLDGDREVARLTLARAAAEARPQLSARPGELDGDGAVAAASGAVRVIEVQPEGGRCMSLEAFRNGRPWSPGMRVESVA